MARLPPISFFIVGIFVVVASLLVPNMGIFVVVGIIFILWGTGRLFIGKEEPERPTHTYHTSSPRQDTPEKVVSLPGKCYACGARNAAQANYCGHCGNPLS